MNPERDRQLLNYRLIEKIGEGGMGQVWKAMDTTLDREVAIKFIPDHLAADDERLARFVREAKLLATLNHPNIAAVYGLHEVEGSHFIAMELIPGEDLSERLMRGPLAVEDAIDVARQVADALEAAHDQGVIHRDLKPANIKRTPEGKIKVLDLGLAKALTAEMSGDPGSLSLSPTVTSAGTIAGTLLGTAAYMSPEQAKGRAADRRADIWAFGVVLHEMLTGRKLFDAETISETLAALLRDEISIEGLPADVPPGLANLLQRCLDRDPRTRLRDIGEARIMLSPEGLAAAPAAAAPGEPIATAAGPAKLPWIVAGLLAIVATFLLWNVATAPVEQQQRLSLIAPIPQELRIPVDQMGVVALSPDGKTLALSLAAEGNRMLFVRQLDSPGLLKMEGTEDAATPFFSPDSQWIGFFAGDKLKKVRVTGGAPVTLCEAEGDNRGAHWGTDDLIVYSPHYVEPLMRVSGAGGEPTPLTAIDATKGERTHRWPQTVPDEDLVLFTVGTIDSPESYEGARIQALRPSSGKQKTILERASMARYLPSGHLIFGREGFLFAVPFDVKTLEVQGSPVPVLENVLGMSASGVVHAGVAQNGLLAYIAGSRQSREARLVWRNRDGTTEPLPAPVAGYLHPSISPDRKQIAVQQANTTGFDIWTYNIDKNTATRLTFEGTNTGPVWSPDSRRIAFASSRDNSAVNSWIKAADGSGQAELACTTERFGNAGQVLPNAWTADGRALIVDFLNAKADNIGLCSLDGGEDQIILETPAGEYSGGLSPNGRWMVYATDEMANTQIFVRAFPGPGGKWQVSTEGGELPRWSPDGKLFYRWKRELYSVTVDDSAESFRAGRPELILDDLDPHTLIYKYDVFDSDRYLFAETVGDEQRPTGVTVVVDWLSELERKVPTD